MKAVNYVRKKLRLRCLTRIVMRLWMQVLVNHPLITPFPMNPRVPSHNYSPKSPTSQYPPGTDIWPVLFLVLACQVMWWDTHLTSSIPDLVMKVYSSPASFLPQPYHANTRFLNDFLYLIQFTASSPKGHSAGYTSSTTHLNKILSHISPRILRPPLNHTMMMMSCFSGMFDRQKAFSFITNQVHCQRFSPSQISDTLRAGFEPALKQSSDFVEWMRSCRSDTHYSTVPQASVFSPYHAPSILRDLLVNQCQFSSQMYPPRLPHPLY